MQFARYEDMVSYWLRKMERIERGKCPYLTSRHGDPCPWSSRYCSQVSDSRFCDEVVSVFIHLGVDYEG